MKFTVFSLLALTLTIGPNLVEAKEPSRLMDYLITTLIQEASGTLGQDHRAKILPQVESLLAEGEDPNECLGQHYSNFTKGDCPIHLALMLSDVELVKLLVKSGADTNTAKPLQKTPEKKTDQEMLAAISKPIEMLRFRKQSALSQKEKIKDFFANNTNTESPLIQRMETDLEMLDSQIEHLDQLERALTRE